MRVTVNEAPLTIALEPAATLAELLDQLRERGEIERDEVVVAIRVNGDAWSADDLEGRCDEPLGESREIAIDTDGLDGYARRLLQDAESAVSLLRQATAAVADEFRSGRTQQGNGGLYSLLDSLQQLLLCICQVDNTCLPVGVTRLSEADELARLSECLDEVESCQQQRNWKALANTLSEDLEPRLGDLQPMIAALRDRI